VQSQTAAHTMAEQYPPHERENFQLPPRLFFFRQLRAFRERGAIEQRGNVVVMDGANNVGEPPVAVLVQMNDNDNNGDNDDMWAVHDNDNDDNTAINALHLRGRNAENISSLLFEMIREGCTCTSVLSGWLRDEEGCSKTVRQCTLTPDQAFFESPHSGRTPLHEACLRNACSHVIKALLAANPFGVWDRDMSGNTPLHLLFADNSYRFVRTEEMDSICQELLQSNPAQMAMASNLEGLNPLHMAALAPSTMIHPDIFVKLIGANPSCAGTLSPRLQTPLSLYCKQRQASTDVAAILLAAHPDAIRQADFEGKVPLHDACANLNTDLICYLVQQAPDTARYSTRENRTPIHILCLNNPRDVHMPALELLLQAAPDAVTAADSVRGQTPLHIACRSSIDVIQRLVYANPEAASMLDEDNYTALHHACEIGAELEIISFLLAAYKMAAWVVTRKQDTAIHMACGSNSSTETVRLLIEANPEALRMTNDYGFTPLHCVCRAYQPRMGIVQALLEACPSSVILRTHGGETPIHLACSSAAFVGVLQLLTSAQTSVTGKQLDSQGEREGASINKVGNTPLHEACFRNASFEHIETLAKATPEWIVVRNNAGYTPLQFMCKGGRLDERVVTAFSRIRGQEVFSVMDAAGHTPLHSACREGTNVAAIRSLIRAFPDALHLKTTYGDNPLHLACFRDAGADVVYEVARASCDGRHKALLEQNTAGQSPIGIAIEKFQTVCKGGSGCCVTSTYTPEKRRTFEVLATLVKLLYYGVSHHEDGSGLASLVKACVCLHRRDVRLDPAFIRRAIHLHPEEVRVVDEDGNFPLHIEASIPVEKMSLLDGPTTCGCCLGKCHSRAEILGTLLFAYPEATRVRNEADEFPLGLMIQNGRSWDQTFALTLRNFPPALHWYKGMDDKFISLILARVSKECGHDTFYELLNSRPDMVRRRV